MFQKPRDIMQVAAEYQPYFRELGIDAEMIFKHPAIKPWRTLDDRDNCTLTFKTRDGKSIRWHIKRYKPTYGNTTPADDELMGQRALVFEQIPTVDIIGWGKLLSKRSFVILADLEGFQAADKLIESETPFDRLLIPTADMAAKLHRSGLHHRDLYLCHFFAKFDDAGNTDLRLIDTARVSRLNSALTRGRWIVKDLAQFWYSTMKLPITDEQRRAWLQRYGQQRQLKSVDSLQRKILRKVKWIAKHDAELKQQQPQRNVSIPRAT
ncbi:MAG TPA: lipopolysaccharide kinase InaA family protein [Tepidisphaeraceae bacterium]|nr:lipopolysaccharide kinase InaA family protein [Tepidisphaeraceae bacterium]